MDCLSGAEVHIRTASSCKEAAQVLLEDSGVRLVLADLALPDGSWFDVLQRAREANADAEVVVCAPVTDERLWLQALEAGAIDVLVEPYQDVEVRRILAAVAARNLPLTTARNFDEFDSLLDNAIQRMDQLRQEYPNDPMLESIQRQLGHVYRWTRAGKRPSEEQIRKLSFGVMASRAIDDLDRPLAHVLYSLANYLDHWPVTEPQRATEEIPTP